MIINLSKKFKFKKNCILFLLYCNIQNFVKIVQMQSGLMPNLPQGMRSNVFSLTGNTQTGQPVAIVGQNCQTDWLMIPCAMSLGRMPNTPFTCIDRICGGSFNTDSVMNSSTVVSKSFFLKIK